jgi:hypothetical protein
VSIATRAMTKHGMRKTERYLPVGAVVTCVGELSQNHINGPPPGSLPSPAPPHLPPAPQPQSSPASSITSTTAGTASLGSTGSTSSTSGGGIFGSGLSVGFGGQGSSGSSAGSSGGSTASNSSSGNAGGGGPVAAGGPALPNAVLGLLGRGNNQSVHPDIPYVLRKPTSGPSYITPLTVDQLRAALSGTARNCRVGGVSYWVKHGISEGGKISECRTRVWYTTGGEHAEEL